MSDPSLITRHEVELSPLSSPSDALDRLGLGLDQIRAHMRIDSTDDEPVIQRLAESTLTAIESYLGEVWGQRPFTALIDVEVPCKVKPARDWIPNPTSITATELDGETLPAPALILDSRGRVSLDREGEWKVSGMIGHTTTIPLDVRQAFLMAISFQYDGIMISEGVPTMSGWLQRSGATIYLAGRKRSRAGSSEVIPL